MDNRGNHSLKSIRDKMPISIVGLFIGGVGLATAGLLVGKGTRLMAQYFFNYAVSSDLIYAERLPFFVGGGALIALAVGIVVFSGD